MRVDLASGQTDSNASRIEQLDFKSAPRSTVRQDQVIVSELELLSHVKITQTFEEFDTLTVSTELVREAENFHAITTRIAGSNFLRIPIQMEGDAKGSRFSSNFPIWLSPGKFQSLPKWILYFMERAIYAHYSAVVKGAFPDQAKSVWLSPENRLFNFRSEILPFWSDYSAQLRDPDTANELFSLFEQRARAQIETTAEPDVWTGGLANQVTPYDLELALRNERIRFTKFTSLKPSQLLQFINTLGQTALQKLHLPLDARLEVILCQILLEKQKAKLVGDMSSTNKKLQKKKLKKRLN